MITIFKIISIILGLALIIKAVNNENFDDLFLGIFILVIGFGLEQV